jgi:hypothetical protein
MAIRAKSLPDPIGVQAIKASFCRTFPIIAFQLGPSGDKRPDRSEESSCHWREQDEQAPRRLVAVVRTPGRSSPLESASGRSACVLFGRSVGESPCREGHRDLPRCRNAWWCQRMVLLGSGQRSETRWSASGDCGAAAQRRPFLRTLNCIRLATTKAMNGTTMWSRDFQVESAGLMVRKFN